MRFETNDGRFEAEIQGGKAKIKFNLGEFEGEFEMKQLPAQLDEMRKTFSDIARKVETMASLVRRELGGD